MTDPRPDFWSGIPPSGRPARVVLVIVCVGLVAAALIGLWRKPPAPPLILNDPEPVAATNASPVANTVEMVTVHVSGAVFSPGLTSLPAGSRVADAIAGVGGVLPGARLEAVNLANRVTDGMHLVVPWRDEELNQPSGLSTSDASSGLVDINRADVEALTRLPGVGLVLAERIVSYRSTNGSFNTMEDLLDVAGIGEAKLAGLRDAATLGP